MNPEPLHKSCPNTSLSPFPLIFLITPTIVSIDIDSFFPSIPSDTNINHSRLTLIPNFHIFQDVFSGLFPRDNARDTRFAINFFTSIGLGGLTDGLRGEIFG